MLKAKALFYLANPFHLISYLDYRTEKIHNMNTDRKKKKEQK